MKLYKYYNDDRYLYIVAELIEGGELFDYLCTKKKCTEQISQEIMRQVFSALNYMHKKNMVHRYLCSKQIIDYLIIVIFPKEFLLIYNK